MKRKLQFVLVIFLFLFLMDCSLAPTKNKIPKVEGVYIKTVAGKYLKMQAKQIKATKIAITGMSTEELIKLPKHYYIRDKSGILNVSEKNFKGIFIKGKRVFKIFTLHPLLIRKLKKNENLLNNHGLTNKNIPLYEPGDKIELKRKSIGVNTHFFQPRNHLKKGDYIAWAGKKFYIFDVK